MRVSKIINASHLMDMRSACALSVRLQMTKVVHHEFLLFGFRVSSTSQLHLQYTDVKGSEYIPDMQT
jgi:hypothetical protein